MEVQSIIVLAFLVEALYSNLRMIWDSNKLNWNNLGALIVSILVAVFTGVDVFPTLGIGIAVPFVGSVLTGILISRGSNVVYDLLRRVNELLSGKVSTVVESKETETTVEQLDTENK